MAVITISRQYSSGGDELAHRLGVKLGYQHFDKRLIVQTAAEVGLSDAEIYDYSEDNHKVQSFLDRLLGRPTTLPTGRLWTEDSGGINTPEVARLQEDVLLALVQKAIRGAQKTGNMIIVGRGGQVVLRDQPDVLHIRVEAPLEDRIQRQKEILREARQAYYADVELRREAQDLIIARDAASADYLKRFYHVDWEDPLLYHLVINTGKMSIDQAADVIARLAMDVPMPASEAAA